MSVKVTVLMPVYNAGPFLKDAIDSILNQTFSNFIFLIINDGSTDTSDEIIKSYSDKRIKYISNEVNQGLIYSLNIGLKIIDTDYIVRMDADDISMPERIQRQFDFMEENKDVVVCGSFIKYFGNIEKVVDAPLDDKRLKANLLFSHKIYHPSAIIRASIVKSNDLLFDSNYKLIEDYDFWLRLSKFGKQANLPEVMLKYRWEGQNNTFINWSTSGDRYKSIYKRILEELGIDPSEENLTRHLELAVKTTHIGGIKRLKIHRDRILSRNKFCNIYPSEELEEFIGYLWGLLFFKVVENGVIETLRYWYYTKSITLVQIRYILGLLKKRFTN